MHEEKGTIRIVAIDKDGQREDITDLYWFEEEGVHDFKGKGMNAQYTFEVFVNGVKVFPVTAG